MDQLSDQRLRDRAEKAALAYREVYDVLPDKIGLHMVIWRRWIIRESALRFPLIPSSFPVNWNILDMPEQPQISMITIQFEPVQGRDISGQEIFLHEVYLPVPGDENACQSYEHLNERIEMMKKKPTTTQQPQTPRMVPCYCFLADPIGCLSIKSGIDTNLASLLSNEQGCACPCHRDERGGLLPEGAWKPLVKG